MAADLAQRVPISLATLTVLTPCDHRALHAKQIARDVGKRLPTPLCESVAAQSEALYFLAMLATPKGAQPLYQPTAVVDKVEPLADDLGAGLPTVPPRQSGDAPLERRVNNVLRTRDDHGQGEQHGPDPRAPLIDWPKLAELTALTFFAHISETVAHHVLRVPNSQLGAHIAQANANV